MSDAPKPKLLWVERSGYTFQDFSHLPPATPEMLGNPNMAEVSVPRMVKAKPEWMMRAFDMGDWLQVMLEVFPEHNKEKAARSIVTISKDALDNDMMKEVKDRLLHEGKRNAAIADSEVRPLGCDDLRRAGLVPTDYPYGVPCCTGCHEDAEYYAGDYPLSDATLRDGRHVHVCCAVARFLKERERETHHMSEGTEIVVNVYVALAGAARQGASLSVLGLATMLPFTVFQTRQAVFILMAHGLVEKTAEGKGGYFRAVPLHIEMAEAKQPSPLRRLVSRVRRGVHWFLDAFFYR